MTESFPMGKDGFPGIKCSWFRNEITPSDSLFSCTTSNVPDSGTLQGKSIETSLIIPEGLLPKIEVYDKNSVFLVSMFSTSKLFPIDDDRYGKEGVASAVVGVRISKNLNFFN